MMQTLRAGQRPALAGGIWQVSQVKSGKIWGTERLANWAAVNSLHYTLWWLFPSLNVLTSDLTQNSSLWSDCLCPLKNPYVEILISNMMEDGTFRRWPGHMGGALMNGISALIRWKPLGSLSPFHPVRIQGEVCRAGRGHSHNQAGTPILGLQHLECEEEIFFVVCKLPGLWYFVIVAQMDKETFLSSSSIWNTIPLPHSVARLKDIESENKFDELLVTTVTYHFFLHSLIWPKCKVLWKIQMIARIYANGNSHTFWWDYKLIQIYIGEEY